MTVRSPFQYLEYIWFFQIASAFENIKINFESLKISNICKPLYTKVPELQAYLADLIK